MMLQAANFTFKSSSMADRSADIRHYIQIYSILTKAGCTEDERDGDKLRKRDESIFFGGLIFGR